LTSNMVAIVVGTVFLVMLFVNEALYGQRLMRWRPLPYHVIIELVGLLLFWKLAAFFLEWERMIGARSV